MEKSGWNLRVFDNIATFSKAVEEVTGQEFDFQSVIALNTDFLQPTTQYLILNVKEFDSGAGDNILFLTADKAYVFSQKGLSFDPLPEFEEVLQKPYGRSTVIAFTTASRILDSHTQRIESFIRAIRTLEDNFDHTRYRNLSLELERFSDRLEEFHDLLLRLQERRYREVDTQLISFDYSVLISESLSLQGRCRRRLSYLKELRQENEMRATEDLNRRIVNLNDVVKKLTAVTVILMLPTLIANHFGMNFVYMPELRVWWAYPVVIAMQLAIAASGFVFFRRWGWL